MPKKRLDAALLSPCSLEFAYISHFFLHFPLTNIQKNYFNKLQSVYQNVLNYSDHEIVILFRYGSND